MKALKLNHAFAAAATSGESTLAPSRLPAITTRSAANR